jgi:hypothetical protein
LKCNFPIFIKHLKQPCSYKNKGRYFRPKIIGNQIEINTIRIMKPIILSLLVMFTCYVTYSQKSSDSTKIIQKVGKVYLQNGKVLSLNNLSLILEENEKASAELKKAKANVAPMYLLSFSGGFLIGWPLGTALGGGKPEWWMLGAGAGLILCTIPLQIGFNKHLCNAVTIYNSDLQTIGINKTVLQFGLAKYSCGVEIRF